MNYTLFKKNTIRKFFSKSKYLPWIILLVQLIWLIFTFYYNGIDWIDSDMSAEMTLAASQNLEKDFIFASDWIYSTEIRVINSQLIYRLGLWFFDDWHLARTFSMALILLIFLSSYFFMARQVCMKNAGIWGAILMLVPFGSTYSWHILYGNFYTMNMAITFICFGLFAGLYRCTKSVKYILYTCILLGLAFVSGLGGIRMMLIFFLPLAATMALMVFVELLSIKQEDLKQEVKTPKYKLLGVAVLAFAANLLGYYVNSTVLHSMYTFDSYNTTTLQSIDLSAVFSRLGHVLSLFGYQSDVTAFSSKGLHSLIAVICFFAFILSFVVVIKCYHKISELHRVLFVFSVILLLSNILINYMSGQDYDRYLVPAFVYCLVIVNIALGQVSGHNAVVRILAFAAVSCILLTFYYRPAMAYKYAVASDDPTQYSESYKRYLAAQWLTENGYSQGYATFWNSNIMTEHSDGALDIYTICEGSLENINFHPWLQKQSHRTNLPDGKVFIFISQEQYDQSPAFANDEHMVYGEYGYYAFAYDSADDLFATVP